MESLQALQATLVNAYDLYPVGVTLAYFGVFALITALCLPGAAVLMLTGGACFGLTWGCLLATLASTTGACLTMLWARHGWRSRVERRWGGALQRFNDELQRQGVLYLLSLRLLPVIPFAPMNLLCGLTRLSLWRFFWSSALGMLPGTALYVYAGRQLGQSASGQAAGSPLATLSLAAAGLALLGWVAWRKRRAAGRRP